MYRNIRIASLILLLLTVQLAGYSATVEDREELYFKKTVRGSFTEVTERVKKALLEQGFGVITEIDMDQKLNEKLGTDVKPYRILGACNPGFAYETMQIEDNIGVFLPCKVILKELDDNVVEVVSINPAVMMQMLDNPQLTQIAEEVSSQLKAVIESL